MITADEASNLSQKKQEPALRRFRITELETAEVPAALQHTWSGHAKSHVSEVYKKLLKQREHSGQERCLDRPPARAWNPRSSSSCGPEASALGFLHNLQGSEVFMDGTIVVCVARRLWADAGRGSTRPRHAIRFFSFL